MPEPHSLPPTRSPSEPEATPPPDAGIPVTLSTRTESVVRLREAETFPEVGAQAGRYHLLGEIGRGGMGVVLRGRDPELGRDLALKVLLPGSAAQPEVVQRFREEAQIGGQLQHPGVVPVYELGRFDDGRPFFTMKLVKGVTFAQQLKERTSPLQDRPRFLKVFEQVCQAVAFAHSRGVIHRDLKPSNVMVGAFGEVQVMDWGLAKILHAAPTQSVPRADSIVQVARTGSTGAETQEGEVLGTPAYMPPEQALGEINRLDERCDVFSLGAILCEILTGLPPYTGPDGLSALRQARRAELTGALTRLAACAADDELIALAKRCLSAEPEARPEDAGAVAQALEKYLAGVEERARQAELERAAAEVRATGERRARQLTLGLAAAVLLLVLVGGGGAWVVQQHRAEVAARQRDVDREVQLTLGRARQLLDAGWTANDEVRLASAGAEAASAAKVARGGGASEPIRAEADALVAQMQAKQEQTRKNAALLAGLLDVSAAREAGQFARFSAGPVPALGDAGLNEQFAAALRRWDPELDIDRTPLEELVTRFQAQPAGVVEEVVAALEAWLLERRQQRRPEAEWRRLLELADRLDENEQRREVRGLLVRDDLLRERIVGGLTPLLLPWSALNGPLRGESQQRLDRRVAQLDLAHEPLLGVTSVARALHLSGDTAEARKLLRAALAKRPDQVVLLEELGRLLAEGQLWNEAIECYRAARTLRPELGLALGRALCEVDRAREGEEVLRTLAEKHPDNPEMLFHLGHALHFQQRYAEAVAANRRAIELKQNYGLAYVGLGSSLSGQKKMTEAEAAYRQAIALMPTYPNGYRGLGDALWGQQRFAEAEVAYRQAINVNPEYPWSYIRLGELLRERQQLDRAEMVLRRGIDAVPNHAELHNSLANVLWDRNKLSEAEGEYRHTLRLQPNHAWGRVNLGGLLAQLKRLPEAEVELRTGITLSPTNARGHYHLGNILRFQNKPAEAEAAFRKAVALDPADSRALNNLGVVLRTQKRLADAVQAFRQASQLLPDNAIVGNNLRQTERWLELDRQLAGKTSPDSPREQLERALFCVSYRNQPHAAVELFLEAFRADPKLAEDVKAQHRYNAACAAALAAVGTGDDKERGRLRLQALEWLKADLADHERQAGAGDARGFISERLAHWLQDADLASVRETSGLIGLPAPERLAWLQLWSDVVALRKKLDGK